MYPNPGCPDYQEYYLMEYYSHSYDYSFNEYIITEYWKRNGGGEYGHLGQPIMHIGQYAQYPEIGNGFNGYEIIDILDSLEVAGVIFYDVVVSRIYEDQQYQYEFEYNTDLYFAPDVGIVREEYIDNLGNNHVWDLINFQNSYYTNIYESSIEDQKILIYPNPSHDNINILCQSMEGIEMYDIRGRAILKMDIKSDEYCIDINNIPSGIYLIRIATNTAVRTKRIVIE